MSVKDVISYLHKQMLLAIEQDNKEEMGYINIAFMEIREAAAYSGDEKICHLLDEMTYALSEIAMGAGGKGTRLLPEIAARIEELPT